MGIRFTDHVTPLYPQKLALTSPTGGGRSAGIVRSRTKATKFKFNIYIYIYIYAFLFSYNILALISTIKIFSCKLHKYLTKFIWIYGQKGSKNWEKFLSPVVEMIVQGC